MRRREEEARRRYSSSPMSDPMLESKLKKLVPSVILLQRQLISQLDGNVIRNTFYDNEPKYISLIHPYSSQYEIGISQFLSQIVALKAFEDTSYLNLLSPMQKKKTKTLSLSVYPYTSFSSHTCPLFHPDTCFWNLSVFVAFSQCGDRTTHDCASVQIRSIISTHRYHWVMTESGKSPVLLILRYLGQMEKYP